MSKPIKTMEKIIQEKRESVDRKYRPQFSGPLRFGDDKQIKLLREWEREIELIDEEESSYGDPDAPLLLWRVSFSYRKYRDRNFEARTAEEAKEMAREEFECAYDDFDIEGCEFIPVKKRA